MPLDKAYNPSNYESRIYDLWEQSGAFKPSDSKDSFSLVVPPPNANGNAHIGTAITLFLEDIAVRYQRMLGKSTLFLPGADHAGFETQVVYERKLAKEGKSRFDFSRDELCRQIYDFVAENRHNFERQFRRFGASLDWSRFTFTLDEKVIREAYKTFKQLWDDGLIYRGERLVNYCTFHGTGFADIEVEYKEEKGKLWFIRYPLTSGQGVLTVATTRPETMLGDTAVAVNPSDHRYKSFVGQTVKLPLTDRELSIIADDFVDINFGTGAVKITPAHDPNDFDAGTRHDLPRISVISREGKMENVAERYRGLAVQEARELIVKDLEEQGFLEKAENLTHNVGHCYKCGTVIEPLLMEQWFVDMQPLAKPAIVALKTKKIEFFPSSKRDQLVGYLENLRDWNVSRQIAWGIPIPAYQNVDNPDDWIYDERVNQEILEINGQTYRRDPDVFDTWFSSSSWPYATLGLGSDDFKKFYPLSLMETGGEILYPWVSRMIMLGLYKTGEVPFRKVYIHGYVMAEDGAKMSKSLGNVVDPIPVIDKFGSDALRMGLVAGRVPAVNRGYDPRKIEDARNFCNKLWNIARFVENYQEDGPSNDQKYVIAKLTSDADHWIIDKLERTQNGISKDLDNYRFAEAYDKLYHFVWDELADWYIEANKTAPNASLLAYALEATLKLAHPFAPFITEAIWQKLKNDGSLLAASSWPEIVKSDAKKASQFERVKTIVAESRYLITSLGADHPTLYYADSKLLEENSKLIANLAKLAAVTQVDDGNGVKLVETSENCWLDIDQRLARNYAEKLAEKLAEQGSVIKKLEARLANKNYVQNAPHEVVAETKSQLDEARALQAKLATEHARFSL